MTCKRWFAFLPIVLLAVACQPAEDAADPAVSAAVSESTPTERWDCRNDLEISCDAGHCAASESFTPMDVRIDDAGSMSVCAYSGCWEGTGTVAKSENFVVITGHDLPFSTSPDSSDSQTDIVIAIDKTDQIAMLKAGAFAHPLLCEKSTP